MRTLSIIVPCYNEEAVIEKFYRRTKQMLLSLKVRGLISWVGFKQVPFYYNRYARFAGGTKYPLKKMLTFAQNALLYFSKKPLKLSITLGFVVGIVYGLWVWFGGLLGFSKAISGWTSTVILIIFSEGYSY